MSISVVFLVSEIIQSPTHTHTLTLMRDKLATANFTFCDPI